MIVVDIESTGLSAGDRIVSVAASAAGGGAEFYELVNPLRPIPRAATRVHGLRDRDVAGAPPWAEVGRRFWAFVRAHGGESVTLVAHNASFDMRFILRETEAAALPAEELPGTLAVVDTLRVCRARLRHLRSHRQPLVYAELFGEAPEDAHNALGDVRALRRIIGHPLIAEALGAAAADATPPAWRGAQTDIREFACGGRGAQPTRARKPRDAGQAGDAEKAEDVGKAWDASATPRAQGGLPAGEGRGPGERATCYACAGCGRRVSVHFKHACQTL
jgi:DNA polymerase-3 subunit epsilon